MHGLPSSKNALIKNVARIGRYSRKGPFSCIPAESCKILFVARICKIPAKYHKISQGLIAGMQEKGPFLANTLNQYISRQL